MLELFQTQPLLTLFVVCGLGYLLGQIRVGGFSLGVAAVLFVGLAFGALIPGGNTAFKSLLASAPTWK